MKRSMIALVPYFGGESSAAHSKRENRRRYLKKTLESLRPLTPDILVGVCTDEDAALTPGAVRLNCDPVQLASTLCAWAQPRVRHELVLVTEADHIFHWGRNGVLDAVQGDSYLVPHRLEEVVEHESGTLVGSDRGSVVRFKGKLWVLTNGTPEQGWGLDKFYDPGDQKTRFGGAYLATADLFRKVDFSPADDLPVEHATGFRIAEKGFTMKTGMWTDFFVEHLSGVEFHESLIHGR